MKENYLNQLMKDFGFSNQCCIVIDNIVKSIIYEYNDARTRLYVSKMLNETLTYFNSSSTFWIVCDESNNPPEVVDENKLIIYFFKKTNYSAEYNFRALEIGPNMQINIR